MPLPIPLIVGGMALAGQVANAVSQVSANRKAREFAREQYDIQRKDNLADWNMQNNFNSPQEQMKRLTDAGLNPNLVYGANSVGNSSGQVHSATPQTWRPQAPQFDGGSVMQQYFNTAMMSAHLDNLKANNDKIKVETQAIAAQAGLRQSQLNYADIVNRSNASIATQKDNRYQMEFEEWSFQQPERVKAKIQEYEQKFVQLGLDTQIKKQILEGKGVDNILKNLEVDLQKNGLSSKDPIILRILGRLISQYFNLSNFKP